MWNSWCNVMLIYAPLMATNIFLMDSIGAATTHGFARVRTLPILLGMQHGTCPKLCGDVLIHYSLDPTIFSTPAAPRMGSDIPSGFFMTMLRLLMTSWWHHLWLLIYMMCFFYCYKTNTWVYFYMQIMSTWSILIFSGLIIMFRYDILYLR